MTCDRGQVTGDRGRVSGKRGEVRGLKFQHLKEGHIWESAILIIPIYGLHLGVIYFSAFTKCLVLILSVVLI